MRQGTKLPDNEEALPLPPSPSSQRKLLAELAATTREYKKLNDMKSAEQGERKQVCTVADLDIIVRETYHIVVRAVQRIERLERRLGILPDIDKAET